MENVSSHMHHVFILYGIQELGRNKPLYFFLTFILYVAIITLNLSLIATIVVEKSLHEPMYICLCNLCATSLYGTVGFYPKFLIDLLSNNKAVISYAMCVTQTYIIYTSAMCEIAILTVMAYDRYVAICKPLKYHSILTPRRLLNLLLLAWIYPLSMAVISLLLTLRLPICESRIDKLFCDNPSILKQGCNSNSAHVNRLWSIIMIVGQVAQAVLIFASCTQIVHICVGSSEGRTKFIQTCLPHVLAICISTLAVLFDLLYSWDGAASLPLHVRNALGLQFLILPPFCNPLIYGMQLPNIRRTFIRSLRCSGRRVGCKRTH
ncbi:putative gustatory receptor clone PTE03 [Engraulis encrasicolus]|uniref:putative gustatory receptor clone PTE03 n=1 Tax=Engraulis encrasicolus TaxID=184585 RepID=UPI002FCEDC4E